MENIIEISEVEQEILEREFIAVGILYSLSDSESSIVRVKDIKEFVSKIENPNGFYDNREENLNDFRGFFNSKVSKFTSNA